MKITGELLKSERVNQNLTVQDVAQTLKLSSKIINAIEAGQSEDLPAKTFVRGFVKSYAQLLKLDTDVVLRQFQEEMGSTAPLPKVPPPKAAPANGPDLPIRAPKPALKQTSHSHSNKSPAPPGEYLKSENPKQILVLIGGASVLVVLLVLANKTFEHFSENPVATLATETAAVSAATATAPAAANLKTPDSPLSNESGQAEAATPSVETIAPNIVDTQSVPEPGFTKSSGKPVEIMIEAKKDTEIFYAKGTSQQLIPLKLSANQVQVLRSSVGLYLKSNEPAAVRISVNGAGLAPAGSAQKEMKLSF